MQRQIKPLGYKVTDEQGNVIELIAKTDEASQEIVEKFFDNFQLRLIAAKPALMAEEKPARAARRPRKGGVPNSKERRDAIMQEISEEFVVGDIGDLFEKKGYDRKKVIDNAYNDINYLTKNQKIEHIEGTKPKKYRVLSREL
jgi:hypothetical protein